MTELRCHRGIAPNPLVFATLDEDAVKSLEKAHKFYGEKTRKRVTRSVVIRRALALLSDHLSGVNTPAKEEREMTALLMVR
jgi:hypothetical protein